MNRLERIARAIHGHQQVAALTGDPDPEPKHPYQADPQSGAGNCVCGAAEHHRHHPHAFLASGSDPNRCVCALPATARVHPVEVTE